ncbi:MAG: MerR family transcriptional regulator, partial [Geobacteraceae bacterium]|nr:MerR family transcriptional regulator [Geobacteraceae bacterium]
MNIKQLSQEVGIGEDTLRVWERRYDFPRPGRDRRGRRQYPQEQVKQLRVVRQLQLDGHRPGAIFKLGPKQRMELLHQETNHQHLKQISLEWMLNAGPDAILLWLGQQFKTLGLEKFIRTCCIPLIYFIDLSWKTRAIGVAREHLISDQLCVALHQYLDRCNRINREKPAKRHCLCLTLNHERHKLGLLMAACIIADSGLPCTWIQEDLPLSEIKAALEVTSTNAVVLSFSIHYSTRAAMEQLATLRQMLPASIPIIAGGGALEGEKNIPGVHISTDLM